MSLLEEKLKQKLRELLRERPGNYSAVSRSLGIPRSRVVELAADGIEEELEHEFLDNLEEKVFLYVSGKADLDDEARWQNFKLTEALRVLMLKRPENWAKKAGSGKKEKPGETSAALDDFLGKLSDAKAVGASRQSE